MNTPTNAAAGDPHGTDTGSAGPHHGGPDDTIPAPGRRVVLEPTPPGLWTLILGFSIAVLAPLFGFLVGSSLGSGDGDADIDPIYLALFVGVLIGGVGVLIALVGGRRLYRDRRDGDRRAAEATADVAADSTGRDKALGPR